MQLGIFIKNIIGIGAVFGLVFLSQQPLFTSNSKIYAYSQGINTGDKGNGYVKNAENWLQHIFYPKIAGSVSGGVTAGNATIEAAKNEVITQKNNVVQNSFDTAKKFVAQEMLNALGVKPQDLGNCKSN
jgi:hypothetical protein